MQRSVPVPISSAHRQVSSKMAAVHPSSLKNITDPSSKVTTNPSPFLNTQPNRPLQSQAAVTQRFAVTQPYISAPMARANAALAWQQARRQKSALLDTYLTIVKGYCPVDFVIAGTLVPRCNKTRIDACACDTSGIPWTWFTFKKSFVYEPFAYCFRCGVPQSRGYNGEEPACHSTLRWETGFVCPWDDFIHLAVYCLWFKKRESIIAHFGLHKEIDFEVFTCWATMEDKEEGKYYNGLEVFLWYCGVWTQNMERTGGLQTTKV